MNGIIAIFSFFLIGAVLKKSGRIPEGFSQSLISFIVNVSLPALTLKVIHDLSLDSSLLFPMVVPLVVFAMSVILMLTLTRIIPMARETVGCLILLCGIGNTSIIGIPVIDVFFGFDGYGAALVVDQSNFLVMCIAGIITAGIFGSASSDPKSILKRIATYPSIQAMLLAVMLKPFEFPAWLGDLLLVLGKTLTPLAIIALGASFKMELKKEVLGPFFLGVAIKLIVIPMFIIGMFYNWVPIGNIASKVAIIQSGMPPMILAGLIAADNKMNPPLALSLVALSIPLSFLTLFFWNRILGLLL
ncbi:AEC family transporter [Noviherbaspirillum sp. ST9]|uniref:AEC family transporter n=1 Tax=Noviherbaspirillum sp. ST9 TaxID=3401606 RepID=UPI003B5861CE